MSLPEPLVRLPHFALASFAEEEGVLLDLDVGNFYRLNRTALLICRGLIDGRSEADIAAQLAEDFALAPERALEDVHAVKGQVLSERPLRCRSPLTFTAEPDGSHCMHWQGEPVCRVDVLSQRLTVYAENAERLAGEAEQILLWAAPHVLTLSGHSLLHAAAVETADGVRAFCGSSGRGKTTLAQLLAAAGMPAVSEDLVLLAWDGDRPQVVRDAEPAVRTWVAEQAPQLAKRGWAATTGLARATAGPRVRLHAVHFLEATRSTGRGLQRTTLPPAEALVRFLENGFAELGRRDVWLELLRASERLVRAVEVESLHCPEGVEVLREAVTGYTWMTKS